jgi:hypothetical protein
MAITVGAGMLSYPMGEEEAVALEKLPKSVKKFSHALKKSFLGQKHSIQKAMEAACEIGKMAIESGSGFPLQVQEQQQVPQANVEQPGTRRLSDNTVTTFIRHPREGGDPGILWISGFPPSRE